MSMIGTRPDQVPVHGHFGGLAYLNREDLSAAASLGHRDLNDVRLAQVWSQTVHADATLARNYPVANVPGALEVLVLDQSTTPHPITVQRFTTNDAEPRIFIRRGGAAGAWSAWEQVVMHRDIGTNAQGNRTISTDPPSGTGQPGDIWYQVDP